MSVRPSCIVFHDKQTTLFKFFSASLNQPGFLLYKVFHTAVSARFLRAPPKLTLTADVANFYARFFRTSYFITLFRQALKGGEGPGVVILHHCFSPRSLYLSAHAGRGTTERRPACDRVSSCVRSCLVPRSLTSILKEMDNRFLGIFSCKYPLKTMLKSSV